MKRRLLNRINFQQNTSQKKKKNSFVFSSMFVQFVVGITIKCLLRNVSEMTAETG